MADVFQAIGPVTATMTVETSVMKSKPIAPKKRFILLLAVMEMNFSATLMEIASLICGAVMGKRIVKTVVMKKAAMGLYDYVITKPSFLAEAQGDASTRRGCVMEISTARINQTKTTATVSRVARPSIRALTTLPSACSPRSSAMGEGIALTGLMKAIFAMNAL